MLLGLPYSLLSVSEDVVPGAVLSSPLGLTCLGSLCKGKLINMPTTLPGWLVTLQTGALTVRVPPGNDV